MNVPQAQDVPLLAYLHNTVRYEDQQVILLNRRLYPEETTYVVCEDYQQVAEAIEDMTIQGAIVIAIAAGYGFALALKQNPEWSGQTLAQYAEEVYQRLLATRPTGQRLKVILDKCLTEIKPAIEAGKQADDVAEQLIAFMNQEVAEADQIAIDCGKYTANLLKDGDRVLTHCFADSALIHMLLEAKKQKKHIEMYCTETRPYFQGARLTAHSIKETGTKVTLVTDNMPGFLMEQGMITALVTAADKITLEGHICNKIGTYQYAVVAQHHNIPFYVLGYEGPDENSPSTDQIEIEFRQADEVFYARGVRTAIEGIEGLYPSFDIVSPNFVDAIVTHKGVFAARNIREHLEK
ncbi:s-methyl-5-thioribose-1-phosphate isomerase [Gracilibacillus alcaliphilus]|uniref:s-methyl-5-thioribose-1-phosphate isomerase n=1 Tax=Gracilibacillus alcaliphilus TaxID=1401441 RepID=UPI001956480D|nr:s-methyl-5-thioribose-1-phosphate isomerase [Gracilibacillus alcaliphilus]MBM7677228.1 methylthioribose-1-phosphate isomerase [Gracilibacillus alcaliphilus]